MLDFLAKAKTTLKLILQKYNNSNINQTFKLYQICLLIMCNYV